MRTAVFGGAFDPPTIGHLKQIELLATSYAEPENVRFERIRVIVSGDCRPDKSGITPACQRYEMLKLLVQNWLSKINPCCLPDVICDDIEVKTGRFVPTAQILKLLKEKYEEEEHYFVVGEDQAWQVGSTWLCGEWLRLNGRFCILPRPGFSRPADLSFARSHVQKFVRLHVEPGAMIECSSSQCRELLRANLDASRYLRPEVLQYIHEKGLYNDDGSELQKT